MEQKVPDTETTRMLHRSAATAEDATEVTPSNSATVDFKALLVVADGVVEFETSRGTTLSATFSAGDVIPIRTRLVKTNTTATVWGLAE